jgi:hypothetical protein
MHPNIRIRIVNRNSMDFANVAFDYLAGFGRRFEENPAVFNRINPIDLVGDDYTTVVGYSADNLPVAGLVVDASIAGEWRLKGLWAALKGAGRSTLCLTKQSYTSLNDPRVWRTHVRIDRFGNINRLPVGALQSVGYVPESIRTFEITGASFDRHLAEGADIDGRYRALEFFRAPNSPMTGNQGERHV